MDNNEVKGLKGMGRAEQDAFLEWLNDSIDSNNHIIERVEMRVIREMYISMSEKSQKKSLYRCDEFISKLNEEISELGKMKIFSQTDASALYALKYAKYLFLDIFKTYER